MIKIQIRLGLCSVLVIKCPTCVGHRTPPTAGIILRRTVMANSVVAHGDSQLAHLFMPVIRCNDMMGLWYHA